MLMKEEQRRKELHVDHEDHREERHAARGRWWILRRAPSTGDWSTAPSAGSFRALVRILDQIGQLGGV